MSNRFQIKSLFDQFPFLYKVQIGDWSGDPDEWCVKNGCTETGYHSHPAFIRQTDVEEANVSRISPEFLGIRPWYNGAIGSLVDIRDSERIFLLDKDGKVLIEVKQSCNVRDNGAMDTKPDFEKNETVGEALLRLENPNDAVYAVRIHTGYKIHNHYSVGGYSVTFYKPPKGFTLKGWVDEQLRRAEAQIQAQVAEIDAEA